jgi:two-component system sensor histidine kinase CpxA
MRTLFGKIFVWFWGTIAIVTVAMVLVTTLGGFQPINRRWMTRSMELYAKSSVDLYRQGGTPALQKYLDDAEASGVQAALIDPRGNNIAGREIVPAAATLLARAQREHRTQIATRIAWTGACVVPTVEGDFIFVARALPLRGLFSAGEPWEGALFRMLVALVCAGLLCWLIARHISAPIRALQVAAQKIAEGDLSVRATPAIPSRNDELADLARDFDRMAERIQGLRQKQQELLGDISHELRSPLARMSVSLELIRRGDTGACERMQTDLDRLNEMIGEILTLTRLQAQQSRRLETAVNLRDVVNGVAEDANHEGWNDSKSVTITEAEDCWLDGDANLLRSCIENVVRNAIRYTKPQTAVEVALKRSEGSMANVTVSDHGPGVPEEALPRLFEPFYRVSGARERASGGAGLGLAIAQKVVALHGGSIVARNREGGGLAVEILIPLQPAAIGTPKVHPTT